MLRFATDQYRQLPDITFFTYPFKTTDDESFEDVVNDDSEPPYPSYRFDRLMALQWEKHQEREKHKDVAQWASNVASEAESGFVKLQAEQRKKVYIGIGFYFSIIICSGCNDVYSLPS